ncbi:DUF805 domain-containing protein [Brevundimonas goettingensis]|uniref:DUF805 domain-containing protein n=1 Tax=Brevundimonas goettingensis TaxID=2774190 RepID=A0A975C2K3_9CAUL|nr:DUF805 domain-containing protein [Brevundimonas goettingensis]QTC90171.1 DUF805 domain-containing protein [Brevundimonas goettingensis]
MKDFLKAYSRYAQFEGRSDRKEFWYYVIFYLVVSGILGVVDETLFGGRMIDLSGHYWGHDAWTWSWNSGWGSGWNWSLHDDGPLTSIFSLISLIPSISVSVRRLHDTNRSGWYFLFWLLPIVGWIFLLIWYSQRGDPVSNAYGEPPVGSQLEL